jgi:hypothetical protein
MFHIYFMNLRTVSLLAVPLIALAACNEPRGSRGAAVDTTALPKGAEIDEDGIQTLVVNGHRLYASVDAMATGDHQVIGGVRMVRLDPKKWESMKAFRAKLNAIFTTAVADSIIRQLGVTEQGGKAWAKESDDDDDISNYEDADVLGIEDDSSTATAGIEIPLGDSGQTDELTVLVRRTSNGWKIANNIFGVSAAPAEKQSEK